MAEAHPTEPDLHATCTGRYRAPLPDPDTVSVMHTRTLGRTGLAVSRLGLGLMTWGNGTDEHEARDQLKTFVAAGGTLLDTAFPYAGGSSEEMLGRLLGDVVDRDDVVVATKAGVGV